MLHARFGRPDLRVVGVRLDMFLQVLRPLEGLAAEITLVRLQGHMHADVRGDMVTLDGGRVASAPLAGQVEVIRALAANMALADVFLIRILDALLGLRQVGGSLHREPPQ